MNKKMSIVWLCISVLVLLALTILCFMPNREVGKYDFTSPLNKIQLGMDLNGGAYVLIEAETFVTDSEGKYLDSNGVVLENQNDENLRVKIDDFKSKLENTARAMQQRLDSLQNKGYTSAYVTVVGDNKLRVEFPEVDDISDIEDAIDIITRKAELSVKLSSEDGKDVLLPQEGHIVDAYPIQTNDGQFGVYIEFSPEGRDMIKKETAGLSAENTDSIFFLLDGDVIQEATINMQITQNYSQITGISTVEEAYDIATQIKSGAYDIYFIESNTQTEVVDAVLGAEAFTGILYSFLVVIILMVVFFVVRYRLLGVGASLSMFSFVILLVLALCFIPIAKLSLSGVIALLLGMMFAFAINLVILNRIKNEAQNKKSRGTSIKNAFNSSWVAFVDIAVVLFVVALVLSLFEISLAVFGFAVMFMYAIVLAVFSGLLLFRLFALIMNGLSNNDKFYGLNSGSSKEVE